MVVMAGLSVNQAWSADEPVKNAKPAVADAPLLDLGAELQQQVPATTANEAAASKSADTPAANPSPNPSAKTDVKADAKADAKPTSNTETKPVVKPVAKPALAWGYSGKAGPAYWGGMSSAYATCKQGKNQSPIDVRDSTAVGTSGLADLLIEYREVAVRLAFTQQAVHVNYPMGSFLSVENRRYALSHMQFHTPSEHTLEGFAYPMEVQIVHKDGDGNQVVLSVLFQEGEENEILIPLLANLPKKGAKPVLFSGSTLNPARLLPANIQFYQYNGSMTTPPCTENVRWHVFKQPMEASAQQIQTMRQLMGDNARPIQPKFTRTLIKSWPSERQDTPAYEYY
jgi:carbonic anhydrase